MLNWSITSVALVFLFQGLFATSNDYEFMGTLQLPDKSIITYKLKFTEQDGVISGESITDFAGEHRTVSGIKGTVDFKEKTISFREVANVATKSDQPHEDFCFIRLPNAKIKIRNKKSIIQGHFYSSYEDGSECIDGDVYLIAEQNVFDRMDRLSNNILVKKDDKEKIKENVAVMNRILKNDYLKVGEQLQINTTEESIYLFIWDDQHEDQDRILISVGNVLHEEITVKNEKRSFKIDLKEEETRIDILAINEGIAPPNTARILISNPSVKLPVIAKLKTGEEASIVIRKGNL